MTFRATAIVLLKVMDINAFQNINVQTFDMILELLRWSDTSQGGAFERNQDVMTTYIDFFKRVARPTLSIELEHFSVDIFDRQSSGLVSVENFSGITLLQGLSMSRAVKSLSFVVLMSSQHYP